MEGLSLLGPTFDFIFAICIIPGTVALVQILLLLARFTHDSPKYLHSRGNTVESIRALNLIYDSDISHTDEFKALSETKDDVRLSATCSPKRFISRVRQHCRARTFGS
jgi:hypothetical protein